MSRRLCGGWRGKDKRSLTLRYRYPEQETKLREGAEVCIAATGEPAGTISVLDEALGIVILKRSVAKGELPKELSLMPSGPLNTDPLRDAVWTVARDMSVGGHSFPHMPRFLSAKHRGFRAGQSGHQSSSQRTARTPVFCLRRQSLPWMPSIAPGL